MCFDFEWEQIERWSYTDELNEQDRGFRPVYPETVTEHRLWVCESSSEHGVSII